MMHQCHGDVVRWSTMFSMGFKSKVLHNPEETVALMLPYGKEYPFCMKIAWVISNELGWHREALSNYLGSSYWQREIQDLQYHNKWSNPYSVGTRVFYRLFSILQEVSIWTWQTPSSAANHGKSCIIWPRCQVSLDISKQRRCTSFPEHYWAVVSSKSKSFGNSDCHGDNPVSIYVSKRFHCIILKRR